MTVNMTSTAGQQQVLLGGNLYAAPISDKTKKMPTVDTSGRFKTKNKKHEAKIIKKWHIQDFQVTSLYIQLSWHAVPMGQSKTLNISRPRYEQWLKYMGKLDWYVVGINGLEQSRGRLAPGDYWEHEGKEGHINDLNEYVTTMGLIQ